MGTNEMQKQVVLVLTPEMLHQKDLQCSHLWLPAVSLIVPLIKESSLQKGEEQGCLPVGPASSHIHPPQSHRQNRACFWFLNTHWRNPGRRFPKGQGTHICDTINVVAANYGSIQIWSLIHLHVVFGCFSITNMEVFSPYRHEV